jgi:hypothetical protein
MTGRNVGTSRDLRRANRPTGPAPAWHTALEERAPH